MLLYLPVHEAYCALGTLVLTRLGNQPVKVLPQ